MMKITNKKTETNILVTGATGLSGTMVIKEFEARQFPVRALVRDLEKARQFDSFEYVQLYKGNLLNPETYQDALEGIEKAFLISSADNRMLETQCTFIDACKKGLHVFLEKPELHPHRQQPGDFVPCGRRRRLQPSARRHP